MFKAISNVKRTSEKREQAYLINIPYKHILLTNLKVSRNNRKLYNIFMEIQWTQKFFFLLSLLRITEVSTRHYFYVNTSFFLIISWIQSFFSMFPWSFLCPSCPLRNYCATSKNCRTLQFQTPGALQYQLWVSNPTSTLPKTKLCRTVGSLPIVA